MDNIELIVCVTGAAGHIATALYLPNHNNK